jgi:hypothetical protein
MKMKSYAQMSLVPVLLSSPLPLLAGGTLDAPAAPTDAGSAMYTLEDIYNRLNDGTAGTKRSGAFVEPSSGPTVQGKTLDEVMGQAPVVDSNGAVTTDVLKDKTFWGLKNGEWGPKTGAGDDDLTAENIKKDVEIFGVTGSYEGSGGAYNAAVAKTGQTATYAIGDDGDLKKGAAWPNPRFTANVDNNGDGDCDDGGETCDGTVTDNLTGLIWLKKANCIQSDYPSFDNDSTAGDGKVTWQHALDFVAGINSGTYLNCGASQTDWRLPNRKELFSLIDDGYFSPALSDTAGTAKWTEGNAFSGVQSSIYWSSTTYANGAAYAWYVHLDDGVVNALDKNLTYYVWPVRGGQ